MTTSSDWKIEYTFNGEDKSLEMKDCPEPSKTRVRHKIKEVENCERAPASAPVKKSPYKSLVPQGEANFKIKINAITRIEP